MRTYKTWELLKIADEQEVIDKTRKFKCISDGLNQGKIVNFAQVSVTNGRKGISLENAIQVGVGISCINDEWEEILKPVDFMTASNSGKRIKPVSLDKEKSYHPFIYWLGFMVSNNVHKEAKQPLDLINEMWYIEI